MLNYLSAELYKLRRRKALWVAAILLLVGEGYFLLEVCRSTGPQDIIYRRDLYSLLAILLYWGVLVVPVFAAAAYDDQHGRGTMKNETVYGIPRSRTYLGKLLAGAAAGTVTLAALLTFYFLAAQVKGILAPGESGLELLGQICAVVLCHYFVWLALLAVSFFLLMTVRSVAGALTITYLFTLFGTVLALVGVGADAAWWQKLLARLFYTAPLAGILGEDLRLGVGLGQTAYAGGVSVVWIAGTAALGLFVLCRREIK